MSKQQLPGEEEQEEKKTFGWKPMQYSRGFRKYFEDWEEHEVMVAPGKFKAERVYLGDYYALRGGRAKKLRFAAGYAALLAGMLLCFFGASTAELAFNVTWYAAAAQTLILLCGLWALVSIGQWLLSPARMTVGEYRLSHESLLRSAKALTAANGLAAVLALLHPIFSGGNQIPEMLLACGLYLAGGCMSWALRALEMRQEFEKIPQ